MMILKRYVLTAAIIVSFSSFACAATGQEENFAENASAFRQWGDIAPPEIKVPTVVDVPIEALPFSRQQTAVFDMSEHVFIPNLIIRKEIEAVNPVQIAASTSRGQASFLNDKNFQTYVDFDLPEARTGEALLTFTSEKPLTADALWIGLAPHVAMPEKVEVRAEVDGVSRIVLADRKGNSLCPECLSFPETTASKWQVRLQYGQPLRIAEISLRQANRQVTDKTSLRFLAQPGHAYQVFRDADRDLSISVGEAGDLYADQGILHLAPMMLQVNSAYHESDMDKDGIPDSRDNCVSVANPDQADVNGNLRGDACDDYDRDSVINSLDNCPNTPNTSQQDTDGDRTGDACDKEESRITEKYTWLPWLALAGAAALMLFFFFRVARNAPPKDKP
jgi:hypothetical protein